MIFKTGLKPNSFCETLDTMKKNTDDRSVLRDLASQYAEIAARPEQERKRRLWSEHFSLRSPRIPILATFGMHNVWCREMFADRRMQCSDPFFRIYERMLRMQLFQHREVCDDSIAEPWIPLRARMISDPVGLWGVSETMRKSAIEGGAAAFDPPLTSWDDLAKIRMTHHAVDEEATVRDLERLTEVFDGILPIDVNRTPVYTGFGADISTSLAKLRGLEQLMLDMYENPDALHRLLAVMRDGIITNNAEAEKAGHYTLTSGQNQAPSYAGNLEPPRPNSGPRSRRDLWGFCAAQEFALISPAFHKEFLLQYQKPVYESFGWVHYGCCEDLTHKIDILREWKNLRSIAVGPTANVRRCADQIGADFVISWRPNPTDMVCAGYDEDRIRRIVRNAVDACRGTYLHIHLKDVETLGDDATRLGSWVRLVRSMTANGG